MSINIPENSYIEIVNSENIGLARDFRVSPILSDKGETIDYFPDYLNNEALDDKESGQKIAHLFIDKDANQLMGYISLRASSFFYRNEKGRPIGAPALEVSLLAVADKYIRRGVGTVLINYAIAQAMILISKGIGIRHIILASVPDAVDFYAKMKFRCMTEEWEEMRNQLKDTYGYF